MSAANTVSLGTNSANVTVGNSNGGAGNRLVFNLGAITDTDTTDATPDTLAITYRAVVLDVLTNQAGVVLTNGAVYTDTSGDTLSAAAANVTVVEPALSVSEQISKDGLTYGASVSGLQGGDAVYYQIVVSNRVDVPGTTAYNLWLGNALPANVANAQIVSAQLFGAGQVFTNGVAAGGDIGALLSVSGISLSVGANEIDLETNSALVVVVGGNLDFNVNPNQSAADWTTVRWSSLYGSPSGLSAYNAAGKARTGGTDVPALGVNDSTNASVLDNYAATSGGASWTVGAPAFAKALSFTSVNTPGNNQANQAAIGELVTYTLTVTVPQGVTPGAQIVRLAPSGDGLCGCHRGNPLERGQPGQQHRVGHEWGECVRWRCQWRRRQPDHFQSGEHHRPERLRFCD